MTPPVRVGGPGAYGAALAALHGGRDVLLDGEDVNVAQEIALKDEAARLGRLVLGPCACPGSLPPGPYGVVAVSPQATEEVIAVLTRQGRGGRVLPVGERDLSAAVCGRATLQALAVCDADPAIEAIVLAAERPAGTVAALLREAARRLGKPVVSAAPGEAASVLARLDAL
ncbi:hypothetical protein LO762_17030 [Actinocorallia sp. API 0066]|uniref:hypothetical protein n=1 Tax=Actinocorallia sp. API 0066 TaxID=2896846 RepID=UPI001E50C4EB|nr:hypothetical protein [Actinocorallia sp. API 0066]MCD0450885.1 hypothetical protein [Actinocorallia sp. API 0066]